MNKSNTINGDEITFVIQGPDHFAIRKSIDNIKSFIPNSKIILSSTSLYSNNFSDVDSIIVSEDPGALPYSTKKDSRLNNTNRQIVSTLSGLNEVKTKFVFKLRSDFIFENDHFLEFFEKFSAHEKKYKVFNSKVLACSYFTRNPKSHHPYPFHISDLIFFGLIEDIKSLYNIPLMAEIDYKFLKLGKNLYCRYHPEQYILLNCLNLKKFDYHCTYFNFVTKENIIETERLFASSFILLNFEQFGVKPTKNTFEIKANPLSFASCYTPHEWLHLYKKYCDSNLKIESNDKDRNKIRKAAISYKLYYKIGKLITFVIPISEKRKMMREKFMKKVGFF